MCQKSHVRGQETAVLLLNLEVPILPVSFKGLISSLTSADRWPPHLTEPPDHTGSDYLFMVWFLIFKKRQMATDFYLQLPGS